MPAAHAVSIVRMISGRPSTGWRSFDSRVEFRNRSPLPAASTSAWSTVPIMGSPLALGKASRIPAGLRVYQRLRPRFLFCGVCEHAHSVVFHSLGLLHVGRRTFAQTGK